MIGRMRSNEVFTRMSPEEVLAFLEQVRDEAPRVHTIALSAAAEAFKLRPQFLRRQPHARQAEWVRKALSRKVMAPVAEEVLAEYFLGHQNELLSEWLDALGLKHEEGVLQGEAKSPDKAELEEIIKEFRAGDAPERRELLLRAFAAQTSIDWPDLEAAL